MEKTDNPYRILGVSQDADEATIKKAYFQLAKKCHPDKQKNDADREAATGEFAKIADAYDLLQDPVRRYDWRQANPSSYSAQISTGSPRTTPMRSLSPKRNSSENKPATSKRANANHFTSPMPNSKRASVQPNSVRVSPTPAGGYHLTRPSVRGSAPRPSMSPAIPKARKSGRSPVRSSGGRSPVRNSSRSPMRNSGGRSPMRNNSGRSPTRASTAIQVAPQHMKSVRKPNPDNDARGRAPMPVAAGAQMRRPSAGRKKSRPSSVGRKPKTSPMDANSEHGARKPVGERRRKLKKSLSFKLQ